jgi:hypothetical protein
MGTLMIASTATSGVDFLTHDQFRTHFGGWIEAKPAPFV